jgi:hypothetical protein
MPAAYVCEKTNTTLKECTKCKKVLPVTEYYKHTKGVTADGLKPQCRECILAGYRKRNAKRAKKRKQQTHKLTAKHVEFIRSLQGRYSTRRAAKVFAETFWAYKISPSTISRIWNGSLHVEEKNDINLRTDQEIAIASALEKARQNARRREQRQGELTKLVETVQQDPELEPMDLPFHYRLKIKEEGLDIKDLFGKTGTHNAEKDWTKTDPNVAAAVYLLEFTHAEEYTKKVYIGCTKQGVFKRWQGHIADQKADQTKRPSTVGTAEYRNLIRHLAATNQLHTVRVHVLEAVDKRYLKNKDDDKELRDITEAIEQDYQLKFFLGGYDLLNASFKVPCNKSSEVRQYITENVNKELTIEDESTGCFVGRVAADSVRWLFEPAV